MKPAGRAVVDDMHCLERAALRENVGDLVQSVG